VNEGDIVAVRVCTSCERELPLETEFHRDSNGRDGRKSICRQCASARTSQWKRENRERANAGTAAYKRRHKERVNARNAVAVAVMRADLTRQPCEVCGEPETEAHHEDYARRLDVQWLCHEHHRQADAARRMAA
jgi:hypothetical protein